MRTLTHASTTVDATPITKPRTRPFWKDLARHQAAVVGLVVLAVFAILAIAAPVITPYDPIRQKLSDALQNPSMAHPLGTDYLGRDLLARIMYGGRYSLAIGFVAVAIGLLFGVPLGAVSGYYGEIHQNE